MATSFRTTTQSSGDSTPPRPERFRLDGPTVPIDPRTHAFRRDIADIALAGQLFAPHYAGVEPRTATARTMVLAEPDAGARAISELLAGEPFCLLDSAGGWAWGYCALDDYVGYVPASALVPPTKSTHRVHARSALVFAEPDIKSPVLAEWPMGTRFAGTSGSPFVAAGAGYVHQRHAQALATPDDDAVAVAERLLGAPYRWGGRSGAGIDCSGLVQLALQLCGHEGVPRDSDLQRVALGEAIADATPPRRGDLIFFPGHVGLMADKTRLIHANAFWMAVTVEPLAEVVARIAADHPQPVQARRRLA